ncbi:MAG TPA: hypothetical protein VLX91_13605 [Candidatus Acidoferrales bacterium]|nr:hypothetical protein [Candidatus Acidoferrales bacterium]
MKKAKKSKGRHSPDTSLTRIEQFFKAHDQAMIPDGKDAFKVEDIIEGEAKLNFYFKDILKQRSVLVIVKSDQVHADNVHMDLFHLVNHFNESSIPLKFTINGSNGSLQLMRLYPYGDVNSMDIHEMVFPMAQIYEEAEALVDKVANGLSVEETLRSATNEAHDEQG